MKGRILVVEDDAAILEALKEKLEIEGYEVSAAEDGEAARDRLAESRPDLVILDLMLPKLDGLSVLRWLRKKDARLPVLIVSAKGREEEKVEGLRAGADDYLAKPFGLKELMARVEALLRRSLGEGTVKAGGLEIDLARRKVFRKGKEVPLSRKEIEVLLFLARNRDRAVSREEIQSAVWGLFAESDERAVDFHILNLRRKLEDDPARPRHIVTRHGLGFQLV
jgi:DNA-binding response OmpR family regulator